MQCKGRYCKETRENKFPVQSGYFTEQRCKRLATENPIDKELCNECAAMKQAGFRYKNQQSYYQGKIDEPYFENSWLFGSPRYLKYASLPGNQPSSDAIATAEEAQRIAREGGQMKQGESETQKKKVGRPKGAKPLINKVVQSVSKKTSVKSVAVESEDEPIEVLDVVKVILDPFEHKGKKYWKDATNQHVYECLEGNSFGPLVGRWNPREESLVRIFRSLEQ